jgi:hypothetical protein
MITKCESNVATTYMATVVISTITQLHSGDPGVSREIRKRARYSIKHYQFESEYI